MSKLNQRGTTLVEVLLTMGLMAIFMAFLATIFTSTADLQVRSSSYAAVSAEGRYMMTRINYDIARATSISRPLNLGNTNTYMYMVINGVTYRYNQSGTNLQLNEGAGYLNLNGDDVTVSNVSFQRLGNAGGRETIRYSFTLTSVDQTRTGPDMQTFTSTVQRR